MSYILDALRRADALRDPPSNGPRAESGAGPAAAAVPSPPDIRLRRVQPPVVLALLAAVGAGLAIGLVLRGTGPAAPAQGSPTLVAAAPRLAASAASEPPASAPLKDKALAPMPAPAPAPAAPPPAPAPAASLALQALRPDPTAVERPRPPAAAAVVATAPAAVTARPAAPPPAMSAATPPATPHARVPAPLPMPVPAPPAALPPPPALQPPPALRPPPASPDTPPVRLNGTLYSALPSQRTAIIDGKLYREGERLSADLVLEEVRVDEVVLRWREQRVRLRP